MPVVDPSATRLTYAVVCSLALHAGLWIGLPGGKGRTLGAGGQGTSLALDLKPAPPSTIERIVAPVTPQASTIPAAVPAARISDSPRVGEVLAQTLTHEPSTVIVQRTAQAPQRDVASIAVIEPPAAAAAIARIAVDDPSDESDTASGTYYFAASEVDARATPQGAIYPEAPKGSEEQAGYLVLRLLISELGEVDGVDVLISEPEGVFDAAAVASFGRARFYPAMRQGFPVKSRMMVELKIEPDFELLSQSANSRQLLHTASP